MSTFNISNICILRATKQLKNCNEFKHSVILHYRAYFDAHHAEALHGGASLYATFGDIYIGCIKVVEHRLCMYEAAVSIYSISTAGVMLAQGFSFINLNHQVTIKQTVH